MRAQTERVSSFDRDPRIEVSKLESLAGQSYLNWSHAAASVGILVPRNALHLADGDAWIPVVNDTLRDTPFSDQPSLGLSRPATLFCIGPGLLLSAAHVFPDAIGDDWLAVFDFRCEQFRAADAILPARYRVSRTQIVAVSDLLHSVCSEQDGDVALLACKPAFAESHMPAALSLAGSNTVAEGDVLALLGYPRAQPLKAVVPLPSRLEDAPTVLKIQGAWLYSSLATYQGTSGAPVLNTSGEVVAVNAMGTADWAPKSRAARAPDSATSQATLVDRLTTVLEAKGIALRR